MYFRYFVIISPWKRAGPFIWTNLHPHHPRMLCAKFGWNWPSGSWEEVKNRKWKKCVTDNYINILIKVQISWVIRRQQLLRMRAMVCNWNLKATGFFFSLNWYLFLERCYILSIYISGSKTKRKEEKVWQGDGGDEEKERGK